MMSGGVDDIDVEIDDHDIETTTTTIRRRLRLNTGNLQSTSKFPSEAPFCSSKEKLNEKPASSR